MRGSADTAGMPDVRSRRAFFRFEIVCQDQPLEMKLEFIPDFPHSKAFAARDPFFGMRFVHIFSQAFLISSSVAAFRGTNTDGRNEAYFAASWQAHDIIASEASNSHTAFPNLRLDSFSEGERCMKDTDHPVVHLSVHLRIFGRARSRRSCACRDAQFGRGQSIAAEHDHNPLAHSVHSSKTTGHLWFCQH
jgi:hypothetical protein